jgi:hypothetical protein
MIETGAMNDNEIVVRRGVDKDDRVLLSVPSDKTGIKTVTIPGLKPITAPTVGSDTAKGVTLPATKKSPAPPIPAKPKG